MSEDQKEQLASIKNNLSQSLTTLMNIAKNHATSFGNSPVSLVESAATTLTATIVDLVELLQLKPGRPTSEIHSKRDSFDIDQLKVSLHLFSSFWKSKQTKSFRPFKLFSMQCVNLVLLATSSTKLSPG